MAFILSPKTSYQGLNLPLRAYPRQRHKSPALMSLFGDSFKKLLVFFLMSLVFLSGLALIDTLSSRHWAQAAEENTDESPKDFWHRETLTGDWRGVRQSLADRGVNFEFIYTGEVRANASGGLERGGKYLDNIDLTLTLDLEKLVHWKGASLFVYGLGNQGGSPSALVGDAQGVSNIDFPDTWRLYEIYLEQKLWGETLSLLVGVHDLNADFDAIQTASLFLNSSHGIGPDFSQTGVNGPSVAPVAGLAFRAIIKPTPYLYFQTGVFEGIPGDPNKPESPFHVSFDSGEGALLVNEFGFLPGELKEGGRYGKFALGGWYYTAGADDLMDLDTNGDPVQRSNFGFYGFGEYQVYQEEGDQGLNVFARIGYANPKINPIMVYIGSGAVYTGLFPTRDEDQLGFAIATAINGGHYKTAAAPVGTAEVNFELTYRAQLTPWFALQPDIQYVIHPGMSPGVGNSFNLGSRFEVIF